MPITSARLIQRVQQAGLCAANQNSTSAVVQVSSNGASMVRKRFNPALAGVSRISTDAMNPVRAS